MGNGLLSLWACHASIFEVKELDKGLLNGLVNTRVKPTRHSSTDPFSIYIAPSLLHSIALRRGVCMFLLSRSSSELPLSLYCHVCICIVAIIGRFRAIQSAAFMTLISVD